MPGPAPVYLDFTTKELNASSDLADAYIKLGGSGSPSNYTDFNDWYSNLRVVFLERLATRRSDVNAAILTKVDEDYNVTHTLDPEMKMRWYPLGIRLQYDVVMEPAKIFISS